MEAIAWGGPVAESADDAKAAHEAETELAAEQLKDTFDSLKEPVEPSPSAYHDEARADALVQTGLLSPADAQMASDVAFRARGTYGAAARQMDADFLADVSKPEVAGDDATLMERCDRYVSERISSAHNHGNVINRAMQPFTDAKAYAETLVSYVRGGWREIATDEFRAMQKALDEKDRPALMKMFGIEAQKSVETDAFQPVMDGTTLAMSSTRRQTRVEPKTDAEIDAEIDEHVGGAMARNFLLVYDSMRRDLSDEGVSLVEDVIRTGTFDARNAEAFCELASCDPDEADRVYFLAQSARPTTRALGTDTWYETKQMMTDMFSKSGFKLSSLVDAVLPSEPGELTLDEQASIMRLTASGLSESYARELVERRALRRKARGLMSEEAQTEMRRAALQLDALAAHKSFEGYDWVDRSLKGVAVTLPYMLINALPYGMGFAINVFAHMQDIEDQIVLDGGDPKEGRFVRAVGAVAWAGIEKLEFGGLFGRTLTQMEKRTLWRVMVQEGVRKIIPNGSALAKAVGKEFVAKAAYETVQEGLQGGLEAAEYDIGFFNHLDPEKRKDAADLLKDSARRVFEDMYESFGTMSLLSVGGTAVGAARNAAVQRGRALDKESIDELVRRRNAVDAMVDGTWVNADVSGRREEHRRKAWDTLVRLWTNAKTRDEALSAIREEFHFDDAQLERVADFLDMRTTALDEIAREFGTGAAGEMAATLAGANHRFRVGNDTTYDVADFYRLINPDIKVEDVEVEDVSKDPVAPAPSARLVQLREERRTAEEAVREAKVGSARRGAQKRLRRINKRIEAEEARQGEATRPTLRLRRVTVPMVGADGVRTERHFVIRDDSTGAPKDVASNGFAVSLAAEIRKVGGELCGIKVVDDESQLKAAKAFHALAQDNIAEAVNIVAALEIVDKGSFTVVDEDTGKTLADAQGVVTLARQIADESLRAGNLTLGHEHTHAIIKFAEQLGVFGDTKAENYKPNDTVIALRKLFGEPKKDDELFDEEAFADAFTAYLRDEYDFGNRVTKDNRYLTERILDGVGALAKYVANRLLGRFGIKVETTREVNLRREGQIAAFEAIRKGDFAGLSKYAGIRFTKEAHASEAAPQADTAGTKETDAKEADGKTSRKTPKKPAWRPRSRMEREMPDEDAEGKKGRSRAADAESARLAEENERLQRALEAALAGGKPVETARDTGEHVVHSPITWIPLKVQWMWIPRKAVVPAGAGSSIQERFRSLNAASQQKLRDRAKRGKFVPERLTADNVGDRGAPIVAGGNVCLSGNGRMMLLSMVAERGGYGEYLDAVRAWCRANGVMDCPAELLDQEPVLVQRVVESESKETLDRFAMECNRSDHEELTTSEKAKGGVKAITPTLMRLYDVPPSGNFMSESNWGFIRAFYKALGEEVPETMDGRIEPEAGLRVQRAFLAKLLGGEESNDEEYQKAVFTLINTLLAGGDGTATVRNALIRNGAELYALLGARGAYNIIPELRAAVETYVGWRVAAAKNPLLTLRDYVDTPDMFRTTNPVQDALTMLIETRHFNAVLKKYNELVAKQDVDAQGLLAITGVSRLTSGQLLAMAEREVVEKDADGEPIAPYVTREPSWEGYALQEQSAPRTSASVVEEVKADENEQKSAPKTEPSAPTADEATVENATAATDETASALDAAEVVLADKDDEVPFIPCRAEKGTVEVPNAMAKGRGELTLKKVAKNGSATTRTWNLGAGVWDYLRVPFAQIVRPPRSKQDEAGRGLWSGTKTLPSAVGALLLRFGGKCPRYMGNKNKMTERTVRTLCEQMTKAEREHYKTVVDCFGGGGCWGLTLALTAFPNAQRLVVNEFDEARLEKIRLLQTRDGSFEAEVRAFFQEKVAGEAFDKVKRLATNIVGFRAGFLAFVKSLKLTPTERGMAQAVYDNMMSRLQFGEQDAAGGFSADLQLETAFKEVGEDAVKATSLAQAFAERGGAVEYVCGDAKDQTSFGARRGADGRISRTNVEGDSFVVPQGDDVVKVCDPPYYRTTGYNDDGSMSEVGFEANPRGWGYQDTERMLLGIVDEGSAIVYTDEAWFYGKDYREEKNDADLGQMGLFASLEDSLWKKEQDVLKNIVNAFDHFDVAGEVASRFETLGVQHGHNNGRSKDGSHDGGDGVVAESRGADERLLGRGGRDGLQQDVGGVADGLAGEDAAVSRRGDSQGRRSGGEREAERGLAREACISAVEKAVEAAGERVSAEADEEIRHALGRVRDEHLVDISRRFAQSAASFVGVARRRQDEEMAALGFTERAWQDDEMLRVLDFGGRRAAVVYEGRAREDGSLRERLVYVKPGRVLDYRLPKDEVTFERVLARLERAYAQGYDSVRVRALGMLVAFAREERPLTRRIADGALRADVSRAIPREMLKAESLKDDDFAPRGRQKEAQSDTRHSLFVADAPSSWREDNEPNIPRHLTMFRNEFGNRYTNRAREEIYAKTGWWRGVDGQWRMEIPDFKRKTEPGETKTLPDGTRMVNGFFEREVNGEKVYVCTIANLAEADVLEDVVADVTRAPIVIVRPASSMPGQTGYFESRYEFPNYIEAIVLSDALFDKKDGVPATLSERGERTLTHEAQHLLQRIDSTAYGASPSFHGLFNAWRSAGEVEARNAARRNTNVDDNLADLVNAYGSAGEPLRRRAMAEGRAPWQTEDVPKKFQIITDYNGKAHDLRGRIVRKMDAPTAEMVKEIRRSLGAEAGGLSARHSLRAVGKYAGELRKLAWGLKLSSHRAMEQSAQMMAPLIPDNAVVVPMPNHDGKPVSTMMLAYYISGVKDGIDVVPALECEPHESNHAHKMKSGGESVGIEMRRTNATIPPNRPVVIIDNVVASGATYKAAQKVLPQADLVTLADATKGKVAFEPSLQDIQKEMTAVDASSRDVRHSVAVGDVFDTGAWDGVEIPVSSLRTYKNEPGKSVLNAARFMAEAMDGFRGKRKPISVADNGDGTYTVVDGTATSKALAAVGAATAYAKVVGLNRGTRLLNSAYTVENESPEGGVLRTENAATLDEAIAQAAENADALADLCRAAAAKVGGEVVLRQPNPETGKPTKSRASAERKLRDEYDGDVSRLIDLVGGTVIIDDNGDFGDALKAIKRNLPEGASLGRVKVFNLKPTGKGYGDIKVSVRFANGGVGEIILVGRGMFEGKEMRGGHEVYNIRRVLEKYKGMDAEVNEACDALDKLSNAVYAAGADAPDAANFASIKARASSSITCLLGPNVQSRYSSSDMEAVKSLSSGLNLAYPPSQNSNATPALSLMKNMDTSLIDAVRETFSRPTQDNIPYSGVGAQGGEREFFQTLEDLKKDDMIRHALSVMGGRAKEEARALIEQCREDLSYDEMDEAVNAIASGFDTPKERKAALRWFCKETVELPQDAQLVKDAVRIAEQKHEDVFQFERPGEIVAKYSAVVKAKPIDPDTVPTLSDKKTFGHGVTTYLVDESRESQEAMRRIINTHWGKEANPWCLLRGDGKGNLAPDAWEYWEQYSDLPKRVAFKDGKLLAFMGTGDSSVEQWWDRKDEPHDSVVVEEKRSDGWVETIEVGLKDGEADHVEKRVKTTRTPDTITTETVLKNDEGRDVRWSTEVEDAESGREIFYKDERSDGYYFEYLHPKVVDDLHRGASLTIGINWHTNVPTLEVAIGSDTVATIGVTADRSGALLEPTPRWESREEFGYPGAVSMDSLKDAAHKMCEDAVALGREEAASRMRERLLALGFESLDLKPFDERHSLIIGRMGAARLGGDVDRNLAIAKRMLNAKEKYVSEASNTEEAWNALSRDEKLKIALATGWEVGADGDWRHEWRGVDRNAIRDGLYQSVLDLYKEYEDSPAEYIPTKLGKFLSKDALVAYPHLADVEVQFMRHDNGLESGSSNYDRIKVHPMGRANADEFIDTLEHETQHIVQIIEGFASGTNAELEEEYIDRLNANGSRFPTADDVIEAEIGASSAMSELRGAIATFLTPYVERVLKEWHGVTTGGRYGYNGTDYADGGFKIGERDINDREDVTWGIRDRIIEEIEDGEWDSIIAPDEHFDRNSVRTILERLGLYEVADIVELGDETSAAGDEFVNEFNDDVGDVLAKAVMLNKHHVELGAARASALTRGGEYRYFHNAGEVESRNAAKRDYDLSRDAGLMLADTEDVPRDQQIIRHSLFVGRGLDAAQDSSRAAAINILSARFHGRYTARARDAIYIETGWWRGHDGLWRAEVANPKAKTRLAKKDVDPKDLPPNIAIVNGLYANVKSDKFYCSLTDMVTLPRGLEKAYPFVKSLVVCLRDNLDGIDAYYLDGTITMSWDGVKWRNGDPSTVLTDDGLSTLVHELQHAIQEKDGFSLGASEAVHGEKNYFNSIGEVEARNAERRRTDGDGLREVFAAIVADEEGDTRRKVVALGYAPWQTEDVPGNGQVDTKWGGEQGGYTVDQRGHSVARHSLGMRSRTQKVTEDDLREMFDSRHRLARRATARKPEDVVTGMAAARILAGQKVKVDDLDATLKNVGLAGLNASDVLAKAQSLAESNREKARGRVEKADPTLYLDLADDAMRERVGRQIDDAVVSGAKIADPEIGARVERLKAAHARRALDAAKGFSARQMQMELPISLADGVFAEAEYERAPEMVAYLEAARQRREEEAEAERKAAEAAGLSVEEYRDEMRRRAEEQTTYVEPSDEQKAYFAELLDRAKAAKEKESARRAKRKAKSDATEAETGESAETADGEEGDEDILPVETVRRIAPIFGDADTFAMFVAEWCADNVVKRHPEIPNTAQMWRNPVAVRELVKTAQSILGDLAMDVLGSPQINAARNHADRAIIHLADCRTYRGVVSQIAATYDMIHNSALRLSRRKLVANLIKAGDKATGAKGRFSATAEAARRTTDAKTELWWRHLKPFLAMSEERLQAEIASLEEIVNGYNRESEDDGYDADNFQEYRDACDKLALANRYGGMIRWMPSKIQTAADEILRELDGRREAFEAMRDERDAANAVIREAIIAAVEAGAPETYRKEAGAIMRHISRYGRSLVGNLTLELQNLVRYCKDEALRAKALEAIDEITIMIGKGSEMYRVTLGEANAEVNRALAEIYGSAEAALKHLLEEKIPEDVALQIFSQARSSRPTYGQLLQLYASCLQKDYKDNIERHDRADQIELMRTCLTEQDMALHAWAIGWYAHNRQTISDAVEEITGLSVASPDSLYCPVRVANEKGGFSDEVKAWTPVPSALNRRVRHGLDFNEGANFLSMLCEQCEVRAQLVGYGLAGIRLRDIVAHRDLQLAVRKNVGAADIKIVVDHVRDVLTQGIEQKSSEEFFRPLNVARKWLARFYLSGNIPSALKQLASRPVWANVVGFKDAMRYYASFFTPEGWRRAKELADTDGFRARYLMGWSEETQNIIRNPSKNRILAFIGRMYDYGMWVNKGVDMLSCLWMGQGFYADAKRAFLDKGFSEEEAKDRAATLTWSVCESGQQSGRIENMNVVQRTKQESAGAIFQFMTAYLLQNAYEIQAARECAAGTPGAKGRLLRAVVINHLLIPAYTELVMIAWKAFMGEEPLPEDPDEWPEWLKDLIWACAFGPAAPLYMYYQIAKSAYDRLTGKRGRWQSSGAIPAEGIIRVIENGARLIFDCGKYGLQEFTPMDFEEEVTVDDLQEDFLRAAGSVLAPVKHATKAVKNWSE